MDRQGDLMALRATVPKQAPVSETPLAGKLRRHELGYKNVLDTLRSGLANVESDFAVMLARHFKRPREAKKLLATLFAAPGTPRVYSLGVTVRLMPAATGSERAALRAFLRDVTRLRIPPPRARAPAPPRPAPPCRSSRSPSTWSRASRSPSGAIASPSRGSSPAAR